MQRGFLTYIKAVATDLRTELGLSQFEKVDPHKACELLEIPVVRLNSLVLRSPVRDYFAGQGSARFSAATGFEGSRRFIIVNDSHHPNRQVSSLAHELGHALLRHPPTPILTGDGYRNWDGEIEEQAAFFSGVFLVPDEACRWILKQGINRIEAARLFGVSQGMLDYRLKKSGALLIQRRQRARCR